MRGQVDEDLGDLWELLSQRVVDVVERARKLVGGLPRTELGQLLDWMLEHVGQVVGDQRRWAVRRYFRDQDVPHLLFAACSLYDELTSSAFTSLVQFRHYELGQACGSFDGLTTVGILLTPRKDGRRPWDTSVVRVWEEVDYDPGPAEVLRKLWGASQDHAAGKVWEPDWEHLE